MKHLGMIGSILLALLAAGGAAACSGGKQRGDERAVLPGASGAAPSDGTDEPASTEPDPLTGIARGGPDVAQAAPIDGGIGRDGGVRDGGIGGDGGIRDGGIGGGGDGGIGGIGGDARAP